jgi:hypothetical protein
VLPGKLSKKTCLLLRPEHRDAGWQPKQSMDVAVVKQAFSYYFLGSAFEREFLGRTIAAFPVT